MSRVIHFEINADDPARATKFYQDVFNWAIKKSDGSREYWVVTTGKPNEAGINGAIVKRKGNLPDEMEYPNAYVCTITVENIDALLSKVKLAGGQEVAPKIQVPNVGLLAYCKDTEGNIFGMLEENE